MGKFYLTTPLYYSNDKPHIGSAYTTIGGDVLARWLRRKGEEVWFQAGVDEHGAKMAKAAQIAGFKDPKKFCDQQVGFFKKAWQDLDISYDYFIRTTDKNHQEFVWEFLNALYKKGEIYKGKYSGLYCLGCEEFKERSDLIKGKCPLHNTKPQKIKEENYFFKLSKYQGKLREFIERNELKIEPIERKNEVLGFLAKEKLKDLSISRQKVEWGIPIPWDKKQTVYCWVDALLNYLSGVAKSKKFWPADLHLIGKDILKFHSILWPALLLSAGYSLPKKIFAHGFFTLEGKKISKTFGNIIYVEDLVKKYGPDPVRYILLKEIPFGLDGDFSLAIFEKRYKADLANDLGNLLQRVIILGRKFKIKDLKLEPVEDQKLSLPRVDKAIEELDFSSALSEIWKIISRANQTIDKERPWVKNEKLKTKNLKLIGDLFKTLSQISYLIQPFMPETSQKITNQIKTLTPFPLFPKEGK